MASAAVLTFAEHLARAEAQEALRDLARADRKARDYADAAAAEHLARATDDEALRKLAKWAMNNTQEKP